MENCIFCKIINKQIPSSVVYEDNDVVAFLDISQATKGHTLVLPKKHYANLLEIEEEVLAKVIKVAKMIATSMNMVKPNIGVNSKSQIEETISDSLIAGAKAIAAGL